MSAAYISSTPTCTAWKEAGRSASLELSQHLGLHNEEFLSSPKRNQTAAKLLLHIPVNPPVSVTLWSSNERDPGLFEGRLVLLLAVYRDGRSGRENNAQGEMGGEAPVMGEQRRQDGLWLWLWRGLSWEQLQRPYLGLGHKGERGRDVISAVTFRNPNLTALGARIISCH